MVLERGVLRREAGPEDGIWEFEVGVIAGEIIGTTYFKVLFNILFIFKFWFQVFDAVDSPRAKTLINRLEVSSFIGQNLFIFTSNFIMSC